MIEGGVRCVETWLYGSSLPLWWALAQSRKRHRPGDSQEASRPVFSRLQQALILRREAATSQSTSLDALGCI
ncbi:hypothetical protein CQ009_07255 [Pseudomonas sp. MYb2]|nr:hypothetical protein CQ025_00025 [Pseudomonas sp. MYb3]PRC35314.1 hypothetical protein CQ009_07255 [Pseudomonas sp. MYb2]